MSWTGAGSFGELDWTDAPAAPAGHHFLHNTGAGGVRIETPAPRRYGLPFGGCQPVRSGPYVRVETEILAAAFSRTRRSGGSFDFAPPWLVFWRNQTPRISPLGRASQCLTSQVPDGREAETAAA